MAKKNYVSNRIALLLFAILALLITIEPITTYLLKKITNLDKIIIYLVVFILPMAIYVRANRYKRRESYKLHFVKVKYLPFIILFGISTSVVCALINVGVQTLAGDIFDIRTTTTAVTFTTDNPLIVVLTSVLLPAICEELLLRGIALSEYEKYGVSAAVIMTSLVFSLFHGSLLAVPSLFVAGVFYAVITLLFKSIYPSIICHAINNAIAVYLASNSDFLGYLAGDTLFLIAVAIVLFLVVYFTLKLTETVIDDLGDKKRLKTNNKKLVYGDPLGTVYIWLFFILSIGISVYKIVRK